MFKYDFANIVDIEATCYENRNFPTGEIQEIIEIGITEVDIINTKVVSSESIVVKPLSSKVGTYCTNLTGWTQEAVDQGISLKDACQILKTKYNSKNRLWVSQGNFDREIFKSNCKLYEVEYPFGPNHLNLQTLFSLMTTRTKNIGMMKQLKVLNIPPIGTHHSGKDDSHNIARIFIELLLIGRINV